MIRTLSCYSARVFRLGLTIPGCCVGVSLAGTYRDMYILFQGKINPRRRSGAERFLENSSVQCQKRRCLTVQRP